MPSRAALILVLAAGLVGACGEEEVPPVAGSCTGDPAAILTALEGAPEAVELPGGATISECLRNAESGADLQNVGVTLSSAAEDLELRAMDDDDEEAALQLGYLIGAAETGAARHAGVAGELVRRLERSAAFDGPAVVEDALEQGIAAGRRRG